MKRGILSIKYFFYIPFSFAVSYQDNAPYFVKAKGLVINTLLNSYFS